MIASEDHGRPLPAPRCTCGQLLILPQVYLDLMFKKQPAVEAGVELSNPQQRDLCPADPR